MPIKDGRLRRKDECGHPTILEPCSTFGGSGCPSFSAILIMTPNVPEASCQLRPSAIPPRISKSDDWWSLNSMKGSLCGTLTICSWEWTRTKASLRGTSFSYSYHKFPVHSPRGVSPPARLHPEGRSHSSSPDKMLPDRQDPPLILPSSWSALSPQGSLWRLNCGPY